MENADFYGQEMKAEFFSRKRFNTESLMNMAGVILFYVVVFVAFSVFAG